MILLNNTAFNLKNNKTLMRIFSSYPNRYYKFESEFNYLLWFHFVRGKEKDKEYFSSR